MKTIIEAAGLKEEDFITEVRAGWKKHKKYNIPTYEIREQEEVSEVLHKILSVNQDMTIRLRHSFNRSALMQTFSITSFYNKGSLFSFNDESLTVRVMPDDSLLYGIGQAGIFGYAWFEQNKFFLRFRNRLHEEIETFTFEITF